jgi:uncharacterized metal-binding protein YceD (DUF177 family)
MARLMAVPNFAAPEWSVPVAVADVPRLAFPMDVAADRDARTALAQRFDLLSLDRLHATLTILPKATGFLVSGTCTAQLSQACIATGDAVPAKIKEPISILFMPETQQEEQGNDAEIGLDHADLDVVTFDGGQIDLGEAVAQSLALALNPYPRSAGADAFLKAQGVLQEEEAGAFGALAGLRDKLAGKSG